MESRKGLQPFVECRTAFMSTFGGLALSMVIGWIAECLLSAAPTQKSLRSWLHAGIYVAIYVGTAAFVLGTLHDDWLLMTGLPAGYGASWLFRASLRHRAANRPGGEKPT
jgi:hypothetical protein